jgi:hypothetical protein
MSPLNNPLSELPPEGYTVLQLVCQPLLHGYRGLRVLATLFDNNP